MDIENEHHVVSQGELDDHMLFSICGCAGLKIPFVLRMYNGWVISTPFVAVERWTGRWEGWPPEWNAAVGDLISAKNDLHGMSR
jgi:hypothetical protein